MENKKVATPNKYANYQDKNAIEEVLGALINNPTRLSDFPVNDDDLVDNFHRVLLSEIITMVGESDKPIEPARVARHLEENYPIKYNMFMKHNGIEYMEKISELAKESGLFESSYKRMRKWSLLRKLDAAGINISKYYDPADRIGDATSEEKRQNFEQETVESILDSYINLFTNFVNEYSRTEIECRRAAEDDESLKQLEEWKKGIQHRLSYASQYLTTVTRGLKPKTYSIMSAPSGVGKTRMSIANMCHSFVPYFWNTQTNQWEVNPHGTQNSVLYIATEMELKEEIEPLIWAYMAAVPDHHITEGTYKPGEEERVRQAIEYASQGKLYLAYMPEYSSAELERIIKKYVNPPYEVTSVFFDYIYSNPKLLNEYSEMTNAGKGGKYGLREDQALSHLSTKLKELTIKYAISIDTCTQVSGDYKNTANRDETIVRGARSIIDKCDTGMVLTKPQEKEFKLLQEKVKLKETEWESKAENIGKKNPFKELPEPNLCLSVYKNRHGVLNNIWIWLNMDYDTLRVHDLYVTTSTGYKILPVDKTRIVVSENGQTHMFTNKEAMEQFQEGNITKDILEQVQAQEREDPTYKATTMDDLKLMEKAKQDVNITNYKEIGCDLPEDNILDESFEY